MNPWKRNTSRTLVVQGSMTDRTKVGMPKIARLSMVAKRLAVVSHVLFCIHRMFEEQFDWEKRWSLWT